MWSPPTQPAELLLLLSGQSKTVKAADDLVHLVVSPLRGQCWLHLFPSQVEAGECGQDLHLKCIPASVCVWENRIGKL